MFDIRTILGENTPVVKVVAVGCSWIEGIERFYSLLEQRLGSLVGFEANPQEFAKLQQIAEERNKVMGLECYKYLPYAVGDGRIRVFHNLNECLNSSIIPPNYAIHHYIETIPGEFDIKSVETVQTIRLDDINLGDTDYLYLDTQGFELEILRNSQVLLKNVVTVHTEVCFVDLYQSQPLFGDVDVFLRSCGFYYHHSEQKGGRTCLPFTFGELGAFHQEVWSDFVYIPAYDRLYRLPSRKLLALATIAHAAYNAWDLAGHALLVHDRVYGTTYAGEYKEKILEAIKPKAAEVSLSPEDKLRGEICAFVNDVVNNDRVDQYTEAIEKLAELVSLLDISNQYHHFAWSNFLCGSLYNLLCKCSIANNEAGYDKLLELFRNVRRNSAKFIVNLDDEAVMQLFPHFLRPMVDCLSLCQSFFRIPLEESENIVVARMVERCNYLLDNSQHSGLMQLLLALRLYKMPHELEIPFDRFNVTGYFLDYYISTYLNYNFAFATYPEEDDKYKSLVEARLKILAECIDQNKSDYLTLLPQFLSNFLYLNLYQNQSSHRNLRCYISQMVRKLLLSEKASLSYDFTSTSDNRDKIRIGLLVNSNRDANFSAALPYVEKLDRQKFQVYLYGHDIDDVQGIDFCRRLPTELEGAAQLIRSDDLDILVIGSNITFAYQRAVSKLSHYRLARVQVATPLSPVSTGISSIDYFLSGRLAEENSDMSEYTEQLVTIAGSGLCFSQPPSEKEGNSRQSCHRLDLGIPTDAIVYASGANTVKSSPAARKAWMAILKSCPNSYFVAYPFFSGWINSETARISYQKNFLQLAEEEAVERSRIIFIKERFPDRRALIAFLQEVVDIYLDSFPYTGAFSVLDPLDAGIPVVALKGKYLSNAQAGALLQEIGLDNLVTTSVEDYITLATALGNDKNLRDDYKSRVTRAMANPCFRDTESFAQKLEKVYMDLIKSYKNNE
ncbi:MAG: FkbM family methyltransferase [Pseudanabaenaceae cyanobacterium]